MPATRLTIPADPLSVRDGLRHLIALPPLCDLPAETRITAEIVLAEALNNIVEHAYAQGRGQIEVQVSHAPPGILCQIADDGQPMPEVGVPQGLLPSIDRQGDLPEGGFGWYLIRTMTEGLDYQRIGGRNLLSFRINDG